MARCVERIVELMLTKAQGDPQTALAVTAAMLAFYVRRDLPADSAMSDTAVMTRLTGDMADVLES
jgi:hypothetical protein